MSTDPITVEQLARAVREHTSEVADIADTFEDWLIMEGIDPAAFNVLVNYEVDRIIDVMKARNIDDLVKVVAVAVTGGFAMGWGVRRALR